MQPQQSAIYHCVDLEQSHKQTSKLKSNFNFQGESIIIIKLFNTTQTALRMSQRSRVPNPLIPSWQPFHSTLHIKRRNFNLPEIVLRYTCLLLIMQAKHTHMRNYYCDKNYTRRYLREQKMNFVLPTASILCLYNRFHNTCNCSLYRSLQF